MSAVYFFFFGAMGAMTPFLSIYYRNVGLTATEIALLLSVPPIMLFVSQPLFGPMADRSGHRGRLCARVVPFAAVAGGLVSLGSSLWTLLPLVAIWSFFSGPLGPIADSIALGEVQRTGVSYPQLRLWGSVSFVITSTLGGWLYNRIDLRWAFFLYAAISLIALLMARRLPADGLATQRKALPPLRTLFRNPALTGFLLFSGLLQTTQAAHAAFLSIHIDNLGGSNSMVGLAWGIAAVCEIPVWYYLARITRRVGAMPLLALSAFVYGIRWVLIGFAPSAAVVLALQLLQSGSFAIFLPTAVVLVGELVPPELRTSGQALLTLVNSGIALVIGTLLAGRVVDLAGTGVLYRSAGVVAMAAGFGFLFLLRRTRTAGMRTEEGGRLHG